MSLSCAWCKRVLTEDEAECADVDYPGVGPVRVVVCSQEHFDAWRDRENADLRAKNERRARRVAERKLIRAVTRSMGR